MTRAVFPIGAAAILFCALFGMTPGKDRKMNEEKLVQYLKIFCKGRANTKKSEEIERAVCISGNELRKAVNRLRRRGIPIGSSRSGYFYAVTAGEVYSTIRQLKVMANGLDAAIAGLERSLDSFDLGREQ